MRFRGSLLAGALLLTSAVPAFAQKAGTIEIGGFGRYTTFDKHLHFKDWVGGGGRLGIFLFRNLAVEGDASYTGTRGPGDQRVDAVPIHARLVYNVPLGGSSAFMLGGGYTRQLLRKRYRETSSGVGGLAGFRLGLGSVASLRLEATGDYIPTPESNFAPPQLVGVEQTKNNLHWGAQAGLSILLGNKRDGDRDRDGVKDSRDQCSGTPAGERVDAAGCPLPKDADGDGVTDNLDRCPGTPAGRAVDATGCPRDSDGDGVLDAQDKCPNTPAGSAVDATGCTRDSDGDGVLDTLDKCPNTPAGTAVDVTGCPKDTDHDGVIDTLDKCPNTPAGTVVDVTGCARDSDGDGVSNANDKCPNTPPGTKVDAAGCPALFVAGARLVLQGVNFETGKSTLLLESRAILDRVAESLNNNPEVTVEVGGHTDSRGARSTNMALSQARAFAVREYLIGKGVRAARITAIGYGPDKPVASNTTATGRAANRRVELTKTN